MPHPFSIRSSLACATFCALAITPSLAWAENPYGPQTVAILFFFAVVFPALVMLVLGFVPLMIALRIFGQNIPRKKAIGLGLSSALLSIILSLFVGRGIEEILFGDILPVLLLAGVQVAINVLIVVIGARIFSVSDADDMT